MEYRKVIHQIINDPANNLTTTSRNLLETMIVSIEVDLEKYNILSDSCIDLAYKERVLMNDDKYYPINGKKCSKVFDK